MASYPVFSPVAPNIDVRLFGDAARTGAELGKAIPSTFTAITNGLVEGLKTGEDLALKSAQIDVAQAQAQILQSQAQTTQATQATTILAKNQTAQAQAAQADADLQAQQQQDAFFQEMQNATPEQQAQAVLSGKYNNVFSRDPKLFEQQLRQIWLDPSNGVSASKRDEIGQMLRIQQASGYRDRQAQEYLDKFNGAKSAVMDAPYIGQAVSRLGITPEEAANDVVLVPHGSVLTNPKTGMVVDDIKGRSWAQNPGFDAAMSKGQYDAISKSTGRVIDDTGSIGVAEYKAKQQYLVTKGMVDGTYLARDIETIRTPPATNAQNQEVNIPGFRTAPKAEETSAFPSNRIAKPGEELGIGIAKALKMDATVFNEKAGDALGGLSRQIEQYVNDPKSRGSAEFLAQHTAHVNVLARTATDTQFDQSPTIRAQYTPAKVDEYNKAVLRSLRMVNLGNPISIAASLTDMIQGENPLADAYMVQTPQDLYYVNQQPIVTKAINDTVNYAILALQKRRDYAGNSQRSSNANISLLSGVAQNGPAGQQ